MNGTLYGVGVGPGDPELLTLKAVRIIETADLVAYPANPSGYSQARAIASRWLHGHRELPIPMRFECDRHSAKNAYAEAAGPIREALASGDDVAVLCEGDPLFYGSFIHLREAVGSDAHCVVIPGVCSVHAAAASARLPLGSGNDAIAIVSGTAGEARIRDALAQFQTVAIMKPGRCRERIVALLSESGRAASAVYVESATRPEERVVDDVRTLRTEPGPYFSLFLVSSRESS